MVYNYTVLKRGVNAIGRDLGGVAGVTVQRHLKKMGVQIRNLSEAMQDLRAYSVNDNYFKVQSHNMAYILGFLASDGHVSKNTNHIIIDLKANDEEILYKIKEELSFAGPIEHYTNNQGCNVSRIRICSKTIKQDLAYYGVVPQKTYKLEPPQFLDAQYYNSYIRGYFDGDGCISITDNQHRTWYICGAKKNVMAWIQNELLNRYGIISHLTTASHKLSNGDPFYYLTIYKTRTLLYLYNVLYSPNSLRLNRKYQIFKQFYDIESKRLHSLSDKEKSYAELTQIEE